ncbi:MAG TPA: Rieske 2Fe-2S domain-containing protein, partial [Pseudonocardiaceae bacterium]|nr:Rieske 2Fe-2S domain-containing protein [Pseudonocardiaceae bacterium]
LPRRGAIVRLGVTAAASAALGAGLDHVLSPHPTPGTPEPEQRLTPDDGVWSTVARAADLPEGSAIRFDVGAVTGFVTRTNDQVRAVSGICTHLGCRLDLNPPARTLDCPCHGATFSVTGAVVAHRLRAPLAPLPRIEAREIDGAIQVFVPPKPGG